MGLEPLDIERKEGVTYPEDREVILQMAEADQEMRRAAASGEVEFDASVDRDNTEKMTAIIDRIGWPTASKVGAEAAEKAWLLVQHADHDRAFQRRCLDEMKSFGSEEVTMVNVAYLEDRIRVGEGGLQLYGTQFGESEDGTFGPKPIENPEGLDARRAEMGLEPFANYEAHMRKINEERKSGA